MVEDMNLLKLERDLLQEEVSKLPKTEMSKSYPIRKQFSWKSIRTDAKMKFYAGIKSILFFNILFDLLRPCLPQMMYWRGVKNIRSSGHKKTSDTRTKKVGHKDQFLLVLMRLRLRLINEDLADRFKISQSTCSSIFATWIEILRTMLGDALLVWLPRDIIFGNLPTLFLKKYSKTRCIIDCFEIFIERPKSLDLQAATWSDYKKHNTMKFLIAISPTGYIMFISDCYGGMATDQFICKDSTFYNHLEAGDEVMADRGFQIKEDLLYHYCSLSIPPGARMKSQLCDDECHKTKEVANLRIHVERAINRMKEFKTLKNIIPINMLPLADDIVRVCAALCNVQPLLIKQS